MNNKEKFELVVNAGLQAIPYVGGPLATLYFGYKQEQRFQRIEQTLKKVATELEEVKSKLGKVIEYRIVETDKKSKKCAILI